MRLAWPLTLRLVAHEQLRDPQEHARADEAGDEGEDPATGSDVEDEAEEEATQETTDDADHDVGDDAHLSIGAHDLGADPTGQATNDDPAEET